ncbi:MAG: hypothetical protein IPM42_00895 [Saprospiraceae bacterium]|nr:hypothetical protein [Saprospiraceae bacterium]
MATGRCSLIFTFRLADSLPQSKLKQLKDDRASWLKMNKNKKRDDFTKEDWITYNNLFHERVEKWLELDMEVVF